MVHRATVGHGIGMNLTLVMALPQSLALARFQRLLLAPYTKFGVTTLAEVGRLDHLGRPVDWSHEGRHVNCFKQMALCRWEGGRSHRGAPVAAVGARVVGWLTDPTRGGPLPPDPLGFGGWRRVPGYEDSPAPRPPLTGAKPRRWSKQQLSEAARRSLEAELRAAEELAAAREPEPPGPPKLRVLIERRSGMTRILRNLEELLRACEEADEAGFAHGPFRGIACRAHGFASAGQRGSGGTDAAALRANAAAVRSAHVLFALHGAGQTNAFFMGQHSAGPSALVDVRPCGLGTGVASWPDSYAPALHQRSGDAVRVFALNVEHPAQCLPPDYMVAVRNGTLDARYVTSNPASQLRDQHVALRADQFLQVLAHAASLMANRTAFQGARDAGRLHAYALPDEDGGLQFGPLGLENPKRFFWARANNVTLPEDGSGGAGRNKGGDQFIGWELAAFAAGFKGGRR
ncbi:hypothetical protein HYH03_001847 [Edaphochlamys debaryana]|uniref:Uncharacterized protein n=1 Tax=Edaphochlamys debaryana TaxID=47281 RepID=A0A835YM91_9CHLO|nr:hypothetical protein HYH03_001847 [Edaphochlamys debaryana]|eukprot:KAG2500269.1 hypothetical protein HYH03_001847 [Edaphochlamys debaryana]